MSMDTEPRKKTFRDIVEMVEQRKKQALLGAEDLEDQIEIDIPFLLDIRKKATRKRNIYVAVFIFCAITSLCLTTSTAVFEPPSHSTTYKVLMGAASVLSLSGSLVMGLLLPMFQNKITKINEIMLYKF